MRRRRWLPWVVLGAIVVAAIVGVSGWWVQRRASDLAARVLTRAAQESREAPAVPAWPLEAPATSGDGAEPFPFEPERPTLVVLLHGMTPSVDVDPTVGTQAYGRFYWSHAFVSALLGDRGLVAADGTPVTAAAWSAAASGDAADDAAEEPGGAPTDAAADAREDPVADAPVRTGADAPPSNAAGAGPSAGLLLPADGDGRRAVVLTVHDGSLGLGDQAVAAGAQIEAGLEAYRSLLAGAPGVAGTVADLGPSEPQLVLVAHSFGGLVARHLLTNPPLDGGPFGTDPAARAQADRIRDRTLYLVTLGTPHEGSALADRAVILAEADRILLDEVLRPDAFARRWLLPLLEEGASLLRLEDPVTAHLRTDVWEALNDPESGLLAAHRARRRDGTPVPIVALGARSPSGRFFVDPLISDRIEFELAAWYAERLGIDPDVYLEALVQMLLTDPTIHAFGLPERGWGRTTEHPAPAARLDRVARVPTAPRSITFGPPDARVSIEIASRVDFVRGGARDVETRGAWGHLWCLVVRCSDEPGGVGVGSVDGVDLTGIEEPSVATLRALLLGHEPPGEPDAGRSADGEIDADGLVPIDSALGYLLGAGDGPYLAAGRAWRIGDEAVDGSWYRPDLADPSATLPWTFLHHIDLQWDPTVAAWIEENILGVAGPDPNDAALSGWR